MIALNSFQALKRRLRTFLMLEDGLITTEWVAITAGMVLAAVAVGFIVMNNTYKEGNKVGGNIVNQACGTFKGNPVFKC